MRVTVRLFAGLRERAGAEELALELPSGARVADALAQLSTLIEGVPVVMAVNREYAEEGRTLGAGDELALIPPVSGGSAEAHTSAGGEVATDDGAGMATEAPRVHVRITGEPLALDPLIAHVRDRRAGAVVTFSGVTREVGHLDYEAYLEMALLQMRQIATAAVDRHGLCGAAAEHRIGAVSLGEPSVLIAASAPHRDSAFAGAREIIDEIKARAPIWKREAGRWVAGQRPLTRPASDRSDR